MKDLYLRYQKGVMALFAVLIPIGKSAGWWPEALTENAIDELLTALFGVLVVALPNKAAPAPANHIARSPSIVGVVSVPPPCARSQIWHG